MIGPNTKARCFNSHQLRSRSVQSVSAESPERRFNVRRRQLEETSP